MKQDHDITQPSSSRVLGRYRILRRIGKGGMGDVWLAEDPSLHRQVAIKTLPTHSQNAREFSLRFVREAQAAAALNHPHILSIHDFGEQPLPNGQSITYIVMPYISGGSLADKLQRIQQITQVCLRKKPFFIFNRQQRRLTMPTVKALYIAISNQEICCCAPTTGSC